MRGHSLEPHFCMFERSQGKHNGLDYDRIFLKKIQLVAKFICSMLDTNLKCF